MMALGHTITRNAIAALAEDFAAEVERYAITHGLAVAKGDQTTPRFQKEPPEGPGGHAR
jgi:hypothetical protein